MMLRRGVTEPLLCDSEGVVAPERAGVPVVGRRLEMMPVFVRWRVTAGIALPSESFRRHKRMPRADEMDRIATY